MFIRNALWQQRGTCGLDWSDAALSLSDGIPRARCIGWGQEAVRLGSTDVNTKPVEEIADGFTFDVAFKRQLRFQRRASLALPDGATWTPEFGCSVLEILLAERPGVADKVDSEYWFPVKFEMLDPNVKLYYQGELADESEEPGEVRHRPDWCVGSYAVYAGDGRKLGHIPRPFAYDSRGTFLWGRWQWDKAGEVLYKVFPVLEMDALKPPLVVDATFGYDTIGGTSTSPSAGLQRADGGFDPGGTWNAATIKMYTCCNSGTVGSTAGILSDDGVGVGLAANVLRDTGEITLDTTPAWFTYTLDSVYQVSNGTLYHFGWDCTSPTKQTYYYDTAGVTEDLTYESLGYVSGSLQNFTAGKSGVENRRVSIYAVEEVVGGFAGRSVILGGGVL